MLDSLLAKLAGKYIATRLDLKEDSEMDGTKKWYQSATMWSDLTTIAVAIAGFADLHFADGKIATNPAYQVVLAGLGALGFYGRKTANTTIEPIMPPKS